MTVPTIERDPRLSRRARARITSPLAGRKKRMDISLVNVMGSIPIADKDA